MAYGTYYNATNVPYSLLQHEAVFDYDNDGINEVLLPVSSREHANSGTYGVQVWTYRSGAIVPYTTLAPIIAFEDVDDDGRPDLLIDRENSMDDHGTHSSLAKRDVSLAHSLPDGTFSQDDDVARTYESSRPASK